MKSSETIPVATAAAILGICPQGVRDQMASGKLDIGLCRKSKGRNTYRVFRAKLAKYMGREPDYIWPEEMQENNER